VHRTGLIDYQLREVRKRRNGGGWLTRARVVRRGEYLHPMPVGALTSGGVWTIVRADPLAADQWVEIRTAERPLRVQLDPKHSTEDWNVRNDWRTQFSDLFHRRSRPRLIKSVVDWPFLDQFDRDRTVVAWMPMYWYSRPGGGTIGYRLRASYQGWLDAGESGFVIPVRQYLASGNLAADVRAGYVQSWIRTRNPTLPFRDRPIIGLSAEAWLVDGVGLLGLAKTWDDSRFLFARGPKSSRTLALTGGYVVSEQWLPETWSAVNFTELSVGQQVRDVVRGPTTFGLRATLGGGYLSGPRAPESGSRLYGRASLQGTTVTSRRNGREASFARAFIGFADNIPYERAFFTSADPLETFANHWYRPQHAILKQEHVNYIPMGGAGLRGFDPLGPYGAFRRIAALNVEDNSTLADLPGKLRTLRFGFSLFADGGAILESPFRTETNLIADAGVGLTLRGRLYDRTVRSRVDFPVFVSKPQFAIGERRFDDRKAKFRYTFSFNDLW
jgi:hypothetical protein